MQRVQSGDEDAFRALYDRTVGAVSGAASRTTRSADHASEVVQEVYLYAWHHAQDFDPTRGSMSPVAVDVSAVSGWRLPLEEVR